MFDDKQRRLEDLQSVGLIRFLGSGKMRKLEGVERSQFIRDLFEDGRPKVDRPYLDPEDHPYRVMVMWRILRVVASVKGLCAEDETLEEATDTDPNPWVTPVKPLMTASASAALRRERASRLLKLHEEGLPLLPPRRDTKALDRWCRAAAIVAKDLNIERTVEGLRGLRGLLDPFACSVCDVTTGEVIAFEELLIDEIMDMFLEEGERMTMTHFRETYGMARKECQALLRLSKAQAQKQTNASIEEKRALQERRLESYLARCKESMDLNGEMSALKELAKVQGLTRVDPENLAQEFFQTVKRVSDRQDQEALSAEARRALEAHTRSLNEPRTITIEPVEPDEEDLEALQEYDQENYNT